MNTVRKITAFSAAIIMTALCACSGGKDSGDMYIKTGSSDISYSQTDSVDSTSTSSEESLSQPAKTESNQQTGATSVASQSQSVNASSDSSKIYSVSAFVGQSDDWRLLLANRNNIIGGYSPSVKQFDAKYCQDNVTKYTFDERAFDDAMDMIKAALDDGVKLVIVSSYRTYERQTTLYNNKVNYYVQRGYSKADAEQKAATIVAVPGTSDHNLGLAIDFNYLEQVYENRKELVWLRNNAERFGFVMRYPKNKENVTGVIYEPWHYRYVGKDNAEKMNELGMCLEEYVEYLSKRS